MKRPPSTPASSRGRRTEERAARRERYLDAALKVIREDGPSASMVTIAHAAGVSKPILYRHFGDRDGLIAALAQRLADDLVAKLEAVFADASNPDQVLRAAIATYVATIEDDPSLYRYLTQRTPARGAALSIVVDRVATAIDEVLVTGLSLIGADTSPARTWSYGIVGMVHLAGDDWVNSPRIPRDRLISDLSTLLWNGLFGVFPDAIDTSSLSADPGSGRHL